MMGRMNQQDKSQHILIVEDNEDVRKIVVIYLKAGGYRITEAEDGLEGLQAVKKERPDLILFDVLLPKVDGIEALKRLRKMPGCKDIPVIMMSAVIQTRDLKTETAQLKVSSFLQKPFQVKSLREKIESALKPSLSKQSDSHSSMPTIRASYNNNIEAVIAAKEKRQRLLFNRVKLPTIGRLQEIPLPCIIHTVFMESLTGRLRIVSESTEKRIYFQNGLPVYSESSIPKETLGAYLVAKGLITRKQQILTQQEMNQKGRHFGEILLKLNILGPHELFFELESHLTEKVISTFGWFKGDFKFELIDEWKEDVIIARMRPGRIILDGVQRFWSTDSIRQKLPLDPKTKVVLQEQLTYPEDQINFSTKEAKIVQLIKRGFTLQEIERQLSDPQFVLHTLYSLFLMEFIGFEHAPPILVPPQTKSMEESTVRGRSTNPKKEEHAQALLAEYIKYRTADYFKLLGIGRNATTEEIKNAFQIRQKRYHPDTLIGIDTGFVHEKMEELFIRVHNAYRVLSDPLERQKYTYELEHGTKGVLLTPHGQTGKLKTLQGQKKHEIFFKDGFSLLQNGKFKRALKFFQSAEKETPKAHYRAYRAWAEYLTTSTKAKKTEQELLKIAKENNDNPLLPYLLGNFYLREKNTKKAIFYFERALEIDPHNINSSRQLRILRMRQQTETSGLFNLFKKR